MGRAKVNRVAIHDRKVVQQSLGSADCGRSRAAEPDWRKTTAPQSRAGRVLARWKRVASRLAGKRANFVGDCSAQVPASAFIEGRVKNLGQPPGLSGERSFGLWMKLFEDGEFAAGPFAIAFENRAQNQPSLHDVGRKRRIGVSQVRRLGGLLTGILLRSSRRDK